jgi:phage gp16-like protein
MSLPRTTGSGITANQIKLVKMAVRQLGMDDDTYREMLQSVAGVDSCTMLDQDGFELVLDHLRACGFKKEPGRHEYSGFIRHKMKWRDALGRRRSGHMATPAQLAAIETAWDAMKWYWAKDGFGNRELALRGFLQARFKTSDLRFLDFLQAHNCIEALKAMQERRQES